jgi:hypothetical protein
VFIHAVRYGSRFILLYMLWICRLKTLRLPSDTVSLDLHQSSGTLSYQGFLVASGVLHLLSDLSLLFKTLKCYLNGILKFQFNNSIQNVLLYVDVFVFLLNHFLSQASL